MNDRKNKIILITILVLFIASIGTLLYSKLSSNDTHNKKENVETNIDNVNDIDYINNSNNDIAKQKISDTTAVENNNQPQNDYSDNIDSISYISHEYEVDKKNKTDLAYLVDKNAGSSKVTPTPKGKRIAISIVGLDGRLGRPSKHADANHCIIIYPDAGQIEIVSIPRDTYIDMGYDDSTNLNKLTICRANKGRAAYLKEVAQIAKVSNIDYWVEFSFSQAMGIIEFLGFKDPVNTLQVLRNRKGLGGDDYQRCYTQGQFIRQAMLSHFNKFTGVLGSALIRAGLLFVETDMTANVAIEIVEQL